MIRIYHNPHCEKSRKVLKIIEQSGKPFEIFKYLEILLNQDDIRRLLSKLKMKPIDLVRKKEKIWIENYKEKNLTDDQIIRILTENLKLMERPIVLYGDKAVLARPPEIIREIL